MNGAWQSGNRCRNAKTSLRNYRRTGVSKDAQWPYFERMNAILGFDDTVRLQYVYEVGAVPKSKVPNEDLKRSCEEHSSTSSTPKKMKTRTYADETMNRLTDLESERNARDKVFLETWKSQSESNAAKNNAIIAASQAIGLVSLVILERLKRKDSESSTVTHFKRINM